MCCCLNSGSENQAVLLPVQLLCPEMRESEQGQSEFMYNAILTQA